MTALTADEEALLGAVCEGDKDALGILADLYEERGDAARAECLRWCKGKGRRPEENKGFVWWKESNPSEGKDCQPIYNDCVPDELVIRMGSSRDFAEFDTPHDAWLALLAAWREGDGA